MSLFELAFGRQSRFWGPIAGIVLAIAVFHGTLSLCQPTVWQVHVLLLMACLRVPCPNLCPNFLCLKVCVPFVSEIVCPVVPQRAVNLSPPNPPKVLRPIVSRSVPFSPFPSCPNVLYPDAPILRSKVLSQILCPKFCVPSFLSRRVLSCPVVSQRAVSQRVPSNPKAGVVSPCLPFDVPPDGPNCVSQTWWPQIQCQKFCVPTCPNVSQRAVSPTCPLQSQT